MDEIKSGPTLFREAVSLGYTSQ